AAPGKVINDGTGTNSLFVGELIKELRSPNLTAEEIFNRTRIGVSRASNNEQGPWVASSLVDEFYFGSGRPAPAPSPAPPPTPAPSPVASPSARTGAAAPPPASTGGERFRKLQAGRRVSRLHGLCRARGHPGRLFRDGLVDRIRESGAPRDDPQILRYRALRSH